VTHIGYEVGFNNLANFNRRFLEIKGVTPSEFRRQAQRRFGGVMVPPRSASDAPPQGGAASGPAEPVPWRPLGSR
jgi:hypothetical protein